MTFQPKILYVEDEPFLAKIVLETLEGRSYQVRHVADGAEVLEAFTEFTPDLCILDVMLPNVDGFTLGEALRKRDPNVPIIFLTAKNQTEDLLKGFATGGNDYVRKPFSMEELMARMDNLLSLTQNKPDRIQQNESIQLGSFVFEPTRMQLIKGSEARKLSHRESQLLHLLVARPQATVERKEILQKIWGDDSFFNSRTLD
ncbi:MAG: response regulator transcription factor, partial [Bacteroidota bacterium]